jgi:hypothetical protein
MRFFQELLAQEPVLAKAGNDNQWNYLKLFTMISKKLIDGEMANKKI